MRPKTVKKPESLPEDVAWKLQRADGFMDLRMPGRARAELDAIPPPHRESAPYRMLVLRLAMEEQRWADAAGLARGLRDSQPDDPGHWVQWAYAVRRAENIESARGILTEARGRFPKVAVIPYNLACYACQLGDLATARECLQQAFKLGPHYRQLALEDSDLEPLWRELGG